MIPAAIFWRSLPARETYAAAVVVVDYHSIADAPARYLRPDGRDGPARLMTRHDRMRAVSGWVAPVPLEIRSAQASSAHLDDYLACARCGIRHCNDFAVPVPEEADCLHRSLISPV
jgi:hypothetical protein